MSTLAAMWSERMEAIRVSTLMSSPDNEGPELFEPVLAW